MVFHDTQTGTPGSAWMYGSKTCELYQNLIFVHNSSTDCLGLQEGVKFFTARYLVAPRCFASGLHFVFRNERTGASPPVLIGRLSRTEPGHRCRE